MLTPEQHNCIIAAARPIFAVIFLKRIAQRIDSLRHDEHDYGAIVAMIMMTSPSEPWLAAQMSRAVWDRLSYRQRAAIIESARQQPDFAASMLSLAPPDIFVDMDADPAQLRTLESLAYAAIDAQPAFAGRAAEMVFDRLAPHTRSALMRAAARHPRVAARLLTRMNAEWLKMTPSETLKERVRSAAKAYHCLDQTIICLWDVLPAEMLVILAESAIETPLAAYEIVNKLGHRINNLLSCPQGENVLPGILRAAQKMRHVIMSQQPLQMSPH